MEPETLPEILFYLKGRLELSYDEYESISELLDKAIFLATQEAKLHRDYGV